MATSLVAERWVRELWHAGSVLVGQGLSCSKACGIIPLGGSNLYPLHWQANSSTVLPGTSWWAFRSAWSLANTKPVTEPDAHWSMEEAKYFSGVVLNLLQARSMLFSQPSCQCSHFRLKGRSLLLQGWSQGKLLYEGEACAFMNGGVGVPKIITLWSEWLKEMTFLNQPCTELSQSGRSFFHMPRFTRQSHPQLPRFPRGPCLALEAACAPVPANTRVARTAKTLSANLKPSAETRTPNPRSCGWQRVPSRRSFYAFLNEVLWGRLFEAVIQACHLMETVCSKLPRWRSLSQAAP